MMPTASQITFYILSTLIIAASILAVTSRKMLRAATYLLFALLSTAGLYLLLNYHFLAVVQLSVYAGGILILFIFAILLTSTRGEKVEAKSGKKFLAGLITALAGIVITTFVTLKHQVLYNSNTTITGDREMNMREIGHALMGTGKYQYILPFELLSILLLTCAVGGILIARKR